MCTPIIGTSGAFGMQTAFSKSKGDFLHGAGGLFQLVIFLINSFTRNTFRRPTMCETCGTCVLWMNNK